MGETPAIAWTDHTFNPWIGCSRVSPGCQHCYAEARDRRYGEGLWGKDAPRRVTAPANWRKVLRWEREAEAAGRPALVFCASLADVFEDRRDLDVHREALFQLIDDTPHLIWQLLTKRPQVVEELIPERWHQEGWPPNVWIGTTVEDQQRARERIPALLRLEATVRFLSCEPLLEDLPLPLWVLECDHDAHSGLGGDLWECDSCGEIVRHVDDPEGRTTISGFGGASRRVRVEVVAPSRRLIDWVIAGGESGPGHRPLDLDHARRLRRRCREAGVPFFFKQVGGARPESGGHLLGGELIQEFPEVAGRG